MTPNDGGIAEIGPNSARRICFNPFRRSEMWDMVRRSPNGVPASQMSKSSCGYDLWNAFKIPQIHLYTYLGGGPANRFKLQGDKNYVRLTAFIREQVTMFMSQLPKIISVDTVLDFSFPSNGCVPRIVFRPKYSSATNCQAKTRWNPPLNATQLLTTNISQTTKYLIASQMSTAEMLVEWVGRDVTHISAVLTLVVCHASIVIWSVRRGIGLMTTERPAATKIARDFVFGHDARNVWGAYAYRSSAYFDAFVRVSCNLHLAYTLGVAVEQGNTAYRRLRHIAIANLMTNITNCYTQI